MSNEILIHLDKTDFVGGEFIEGELELKVDTAIPVRGVRILFHGFEKSYWTTGSGKVRTSASGRNRAIHSETRDLFKQEVTLFGDPPLDAGALISDSFTGLFSSGHYHTLEPGDYRYPFSCKLPERLPGDYEDDAERSRIAYLVKGYVDIPLKVDIEQTVPLTMHETHDQSAAEAVTATGDKEFAFSGDAPVKMSASLDQNLHLPGDTVNCKLTVKNKSKKKIKGVIVSLRKTESLRARDATSAKTAEIHSARYGKTTVAAGKTADIELDFTIPRNLYPTILSSELVKVEYEIDFRLDIPWAVDLHVAVPIVLLEEEGRPGGVSLVREKS